MPDATRCTAAMARYGMRYRVVRGRPGWKTAESRSTALRARARGEEEPVARSLKPVGPFRRPLLAYVMPRPKGDGGCCSRRVSLRSGERMRDKMVVCVVQQQLLGSIATSSCSEHSSVERGESRSSCGVRRCRPTKHETLQSGPLSVPGVATGSISPEGKDERSGNYQRSAAGKSNRMYVGVCRRRSSAGCAAQQFAIL